MKKPMKHLLKSIFNGASATAGAVMLTAIFSDARKYGAGWYTLKRTLVTWAVAGSTLLNTAIGCAEGLRFLDEVAEEVLADDDQSEKEETETTE